MIDSLYTGAILVAEVLMIALDLCITRDSAECVEESSGPPRLEVVTVLMLVYGQQSGFSDSQPIKGTNEYVVERSKSVHCGVEQYPVRMGPEVQVG